MTQNQTIHASLDEKLIRNADRYFTAGLSQIIDEVVQNARRAGAHKLDFRLDGTTLTVVDDGRGLPAEKAHVLLRLGGSNNTAEIETAENAAGMGFFSMARYGVTVRSHDWRMTVNPGAFNGSEPAILTTGLERVAGLTLEIPNLNTASDWHKLTRAELILDATRYSGLRVELTGFSDENGVHEPQNFLAQIGPGHEVAVREAHGTTIKVGRSAYGEKRVMLNFYGKVITFNDFHGLAGNETVAAMVEKADGTRTIESKRMNMLVLIDVHDTSCLALQLPERNKLVENEGIDRVVEAARELQREILRRPGQINGLARDHALRQGPGQDLPPAQVPLYTALAHEDDYYGPVAMTREGQIITSDGRSREPHEVIAAESSHLFTSLLEMPRAKESLGDRMLIERDRLVEAFGEDVLTEIDTVQLIIRANDEEIVQDLDSIAADYDEVSEAIGPDSEIAQLGNRIVQDIALAFDLTGPEGDESIVVSLDAFYHSPDGDVWTPKVLVVPQTKADVFNGMIRGITWFNEDNDYDAQRLEAEEIYSAIYAAAVGQSEEALVQDIREAVERLVSRHLGWRRDIQRIFDIGLRVQHDANGVAILNAGLTDGTAPSTATKAKRPRQKKGPVKAAA
jgi:hypothetical protein